MTFTDEEQLRAKPEDIEPIKDPELFRSFVEQNWNHIRHLETVRLWTTNSYAFILAAALAFASSIPDKVIRAFLLTALLFIAILGVLMNLRIKADVEDAFRRLDRLLMERVGLAEQLRFWRVYRICSTHQCSLDVLVVLYRHGPALPAPALTRAGHNFMVP